MPKFSRECVVQDRIDCTENILTVAKLVHLCVLPVDIDAGLGEHQVPEVHEDALPAVEGGQGVVDHEATPGQPECGKDCHNCDQHLHHLDMQFGGTGKKEKNLPAGELGCFGCCLGW